jgi:hypothetical protein
MVPNSRINSGSHGLVLTFRENKQSGMKINYADCGENKKSSTV